MKYSVYAQVGIKRTKTRLGKPRRVEIIRVSKHAKAKRPKAKDKSESRPNE